MSKPHLTIGTVSDLTCPFCGMGFEVALKASHRSFKPGSMAMCGACGEVSVAGPEPKLQLRKPTQEELQKVNLRALQIGRQIYSAARDSKDP